MPIARAFLGIYLSTLIAGCANLPIWTEEDEDYEVSTGEQRHAEILKFAPEIKNEKLAEFVTTVGHKLAAASDRPTLKWKFTVLDSPAENAFATQGGYVYITRGLLVYLRDESDLAAVLAHEIAHICRRDAIHASRRAGIAGIAALGLIVAAPAVILFPQAVAAPVGMGLSAVNRSDESAADQLGTTFLTRAGYRPEAMQEAFDVLNSIETYKKSVGNVRESWWHRAYAQHPETMQRQARVAALTGAQNTETKEKLDTQFLALLEGMEVGNSSGEGIFFEGKRYFPDLGIAMAIPSGWRVNAFKGRNGTPPGIWLGNEKAGSMVIHKRPIVDLAENVCDSMEHTFQRTTLEERTPLHSGDTSTCTTLGSRQVGLIFKSLYWQRVGIVRIDREHYLTFNGYMASQKKNEDEFNAADQTFLTIAKSIEVPPAKKVPARPQLHVYRARAGDSFESLATEMTMPTDGARLLRALNVRSPEEKLSAGETIKVVR